MALAGAAGFNEVDAGKVAIAVTEAATNVLKHAGGGEILLRTTEAGVEMLAIDRGPGIADLPEALRDGQSSSGTAGIGLGAISRLAGSFDIYTGEGLGTAVVAQFHPASYRPPSGCGRNWKLGLPRRYIRAKRCAATPGHGRIVPFSSPMDWAMGFRRRKRRERR